MNSRPLRLFVFFVAALPVLAADEMDLDLDFGEPKPVQLQLEADLCQASLRMRVNRAMQREYESKTGEDGWLEMIETFQQEAKEGKREMDGLQAEYRKHFGQRFDTRACGEESVAHTVMEKLGSPPPDDPKELEEYVAIVPEPNFVLAVCGLRAAIEAQTKARDLANTLAASKPGTKPKKTGTKKGKSAPGANDAPTPDASAASPGATKLQRLEESYVKRFGKKLDLSRCPG